jgi:hypothetical protein
MKTTSVFILSFGFIMACCNSKRKMSVEEQRFKSDSAMIADIKFENKLVKEKPIKGRVIKIDTTTQLQICIATIQLSNDSSKSYVEIKDYLLNPCKDKDSFLKNISAGDSILKEKDTYRIIVVKRSTKKRSEYLLPLLYLEE